MVKGRLGEMEHMRRSGSEEAWRMRRGSCLRRWRLCSSGECNWTDERLRMPARTTGRHSSWLLSSEHSALAPCPRDGRLVRRSSQKGDVALPSLLPSSTQHCGPGHGTGTDPLQVIWNQEVVLTSTSPLSTSFIWVSVNVPENRIALQLRFSKSVVACHARSHGSALP